MSHKFVTGSITFEISGYSYTKRLGDKSYVESDAITVGNKNWAVAFYPFGFNENGADHVAAGLKLLTHHSKAKAVHAFYMLDYSTNEWEPMMTADCSPLLTYSTISGTAFWGRDTLIKRSDLEAADSKFLKDDTLSIKCIFWVGVKE